MSFAQFHFIRPEWLLLAPIAILLWLWIARSAKTTDWAKHLPQKTLEVLAVGQSLNRNLVRQFLLVFSLLIIVAAAGPSWIKQKVAALENQRALVVLLDLSPSLLSTDVKPDRITRARFELIDVIRLFKDGQLGLVAYAGSAHIVSPLTDDPRNIEALIPALSPELMPEQGSNVEAAIALAQRLLDDAGIAGGNLLLITDGVDAKAVDSVTASLRYGRSLSILGVGGTEPTPIPSAEGGFVRNSAGDIVLTQLKVSSLRSLANRSGGQFATLRADDSDIKSLISKVDIENGGTNNSIDGSSTHSETEYDSWADMGFILVLLALPLFIMLFRKGAIYIVVIGIFIPLSQDVKAAESSWRDLFRTQDQKAVQLMKEGQYADAAQTFKRQDWSAAAHFRDEQYENAAQQLEGQTDALSLYNRATALAMSGRFEEAIDGYDQLLEQQSDHADARHNKKVLEDLLEQAQQQNNQEQDNSASENEEQQGNEGSKSEGQESDNQNSESAQQEQNSESGESSQQQNQKQDQTENAQQDESNSDSSQAANEDTKSLSEKHAEQSEQESEQSSSSENGDDQQTENNAEAAEVAQASDDGSLEQEGAAQAAEQSSKEIDLLSADSEQWLRGIEDDPAGLLRRKFEYQAWQRQQQINNNQGSATSNSSEERY